MSGQIIYSVEIWQGAFKIDLLAKVKTLHNKAFRQKVDQDRAIRAVGFGLWICVVSPLHTQWLFRSIRCRGFRAEWNENQIRS
jgi:hypothetical protein